MDRFLCIYYMFVALFPIISGSDVPGVPDDRELKIKISRGSGMGVIHPGYIILVLFAFGSFIGLMRLILLYKRDQELRNNEKTLFLTPY